MGTLSRGITPRDRLDRLLSLFSSEIGPQLLQNDLIADWPIQIGHQQRLLGELSKSPDFVLDAYQCAKIIRDRSHSLFSTATLKQLSQTAARELLALRNAHAHEEDITPSDVARASKLVKGLLEIFGLADTAQYAVDLALPPSIEYVADLRRILIENAKKRRLITYEEALLFLGLPQDEVGYRILYRQLNVLAAKQLILDEPQLCALVVLDSDQIPGNGFYWVVDTDRSADVATKKAAHAMALQRVLEYRW